MWVISIATLLLTLSIVYFTYTNQKIFEDLVAAIKLLSHAEGQHVDAMVKGIKEDNSWQVAAIKRYLGDELDKLHNPGNGAMKPANPSVHRKRVIKKPGRRFTPEQRAVSSLKAKEMWEKRRESKSKQGEAV